MDRINRPKMRTVMKARDLTYPTLADLVGLPWQSLTQARITGDARVRIEAALGLEPGSLLEKPEPSGEPIDAYRLQVALGQLKISPRDLADRLGLSLSEYHSLCVACRERPPHGFREMVERELGLEAGSLSA